MPRKSAVDPRRERVKDIAGGLPEAAARDQQHIKFEVRGKSFAYYLDDHHGDGRVAINIKAAPGQQQALIAAYPERFFRPPYVGHRGWLGIRFNDGVDWDELQGIVEDAFATVAPKKLLR